MVSAIKIPMNPMTGSDNDVNGDNVHGDDDDGNDDDDDEVDDDNVDDNDDNWMRSI